MGKKAPIQRKQQQQQVVVVSRKKRNDNDSADDLQALLRQMPVAQAVLQQDTEAMARILQESLPINKKGKQQAATATATVDSVQIVKSVGESFTGGRSTPVYFVEAQVCRGGGGDGPKRTRRFVVKLVCMPLAGDDNDNDDSSNNNTAAAAAAAVLRRRESYAVERRFYADTAQRVRTAAGLHIPKLLASDLDGTKPWPTFCILMNDLSQQFPMHPAFLSRYQAACALMWIARFHALFWGETSSSKNNSCTWRRDLWDRGAFWTTRTVGTEGIAMAWTKTMRFLEQKHAAEFVTAHTAGLGRRIQQAGASIAKFLDQQSTNSAATTSTGSSSSYGTLIHGDFKAANLFFSANPSDDGDDDNEPCADRVAAVDFQFTGGGLCVEDVAYLLHPDARGDFFAHEQDLLQIYHQELVAQLVTQQKGGPSTLPFAIFLQLYELARIDMTRYWLCKNQWAASTAGEAKLVSVIESAMDQIDGGQVLDSEEEYQAALVKFVGL